MSGISELNSEGLKRINNLLEQHPDYLRGYDHFLTNLSINTRYQYIIDVISFMEYTNKSVDDLTEEDFISYLSHKKYKDDGEEVTSSCQIKIFSSLKRFSEYLFYSKKIERNFMADVKKPKQRESQKTKQKREKGFLTDEEIKIVLKGIDKQKISGEYGEELKIRDKTILYVFLTTGIRKSALRALDIGDVDFKNSVLNVTDKGSKVRNIYISKEVIYLLNKWIQARNRMLQDTSDGTDALFISSTKKRISLKGIDRLVGRYCNCVSGKNITPHKLRATYGTNLYEQTHDIKFVQECMGHSSTSVTERYIRGRQDKTKEASHIMSRLIK